MRQTIAVIGTGIGGLAAAYLLHPYHEITVYEKAHWIGGHSNTVDVPGLKGAIPVDTGFIVYNEKAYPNLTALFAHLGVTTKLADMSLAVSLDGGALEYRGELTRGLFAQRTNLVRPRFWSMISSLIRFYRQAPRDLAKMEARGLTLGEYLEQENFSAAFRDDHLLPMAAAIWSAPATAMLNYPAASFVRFYVNHGLLDLANRPLWRTVDGGSRSYVEKLTAGFRDRIRLGVGVSAVRRTANGIEIRDSAGGMARYDQVVLATHADQALALLNDPDEDEKRLLGAFRYSVNHMVLHRDATLMPKRRSAWAAWNYIGARGETAENVSVTYWMNALQGIASTDPLFVSLNPGRPPDDENILHRVTYEHPIFDLTAMGAQKRLWSLQGRRNTWYCGAYFGAGFHEDGLQAGLAVGERLSGVKRPWRVAHESGRIVITPETSSPKVLAAAS